MRLSESRFRQIIKEEARRFLREGGDPRIDDHQDNDIAVWKLIDALGNPGAEDIYPEAGELRREIQKRKGDFDDGLAVIRPSRKGEGLDIFFSPLGNVDPINRTPMPGKILNFAGTFYRKGLDSAGARRRHISGY